MINKQTLELYIYVDGINDVPFFSGSYEQFILSNGEQFITSDNKIFNVRALNEDIVIHAFTYNAKRMGSAPTITTTIKYPECLDELFSQKVYALFNGEKYFLVATPSSSYSNEEIMYKHEATFVSERIALENTYFYDVVPENAVVDEPVSNNSDFVLSLKIDEFATRMNYSLQYAGLQVVDENGKYVSGYKVEVDEGITSDEKFMSVENKFFSEVLQEVYNTFDLPYYFVGKEIHIGYSTNAINEVFRYGDSDALVSITKSNTNNRIINRATGIGSEDNLPYYYPNLSPKGNVYVDVADSVGITKEDVVITNHTTFAEKIETNKPISYVVNDSILAESYRFKQTFTSSYDREVEKTFYAGYSSWTDKICSIEGTIYNTTDGSKVHNANGRLFRFTSQLNIVDRFWRGDYHADVDVYNVPNKQIIKQLTLIIIGYDANGKRIQSETIQGNESLEFLIPNDWFSVSWTCSIQYKVFGYDSSTVKFNMDLSLVTTPYWKYDGKKIELSDIGLQVNNTPIDGDTIVQQYAGYITPQKTLMPPIYRETLGAQRFYDAISGEYIIPNEEGVCLVTNPRYEFENEYNGHNPKEQIVQFEEIKPTIKEVRNAEGLRIDMFSEFAFDRDDNDETYETEEGALEYRHPLFFGKLRKLDFNLFDHAIEGGEMTIAMTDGSCGACEFKIAVDENSKKNTVQVDENGDLIRDDKGDVLCGDKNRQSPVNEQDRQQDTINNEVWIALYKDKDTFGEIMPSVQHNLVPKACSTPTENDGDTFVILHISLPQAYIENAEKQLEQQIIYFMYDNNREKFNFSIKFSRIYFAEHPEILSLLDENARITVEYNDVETQLYVSSITYKTTENDILPEITVELKDEVTVTQNQVQKATNQLKSEIYRTLYGIDVIAQGSRTFLRKDQPDTALQPITFKSNTNLYGGAIVDEKIESKDYFEGVKGLSIRKDENNDWHIETDYLHARKKFSAKEVEIQKVYHISGAQIKSSASMICSRVDDIGEAYRCWFDTVDDDGNTIYNQFIVGDQAYVQTFNLIDDGDGNTTNHFYWRLVESVSDDSIVLSKIVCAEGSTEPMVGDNIVQLGYQGDDRPERQVAVIDAGAGEGAPYYRQYVGISSFALPEPETQLKPNDNRLKGRVDIKEGSLLSGVIAVKDENDDNIVAVINGADNLVDENGRKLVVAAGVTNVEKNEETITNLEATTKIFDDGTLALGNKVGMTGAGNTDVRIWAGETEDNKDNAPFQVLQDGRIIATKADIKGVVNADSGSFNNGVFNNVTIKGSFSSPFSEHQKVYIVWKHSILNNGTFVEILSTCTRYEEGDLDIGHTSHGFDLAPLYCWESEEGTLVYLSKREIPEKDQLVFVKSTQYPNQFEQDGTISDVFGGISNEDIDGEDGINKKDNIALALSYKVTIDADTLSWDTSNSGRLVRFVHAKYDDNIAENRVYIEAPEGKYFYEDGERYSKISLSREIIEMLGYGTNDEFYGWFILNRKMVETKNSYGATHPILFQGMIDNNKLVRFWSSRLHHTSRESGGVSHAGGNGEVTIYLNRLGSPNISDYRGLEDTSNWGVLVSSGNVHTKEYIPSVTVEGINFNAIRFNLDYSDNNCVMFQVISTADWKKLNLE